MARLTQLYRLQDVDEAILDGESRLQEIERILAEDKAVAAAAAEQERAKAVYISARNDFGEAEQAVEAQRAKIEKTEAALYGGAVTNPKELEDLQQESGSLRRHMSTLEDRYLEALAKQEAFEAAYDAANSALESAQQLAADRSIELSQEREEIQKELARLREEQTAAIGNVSEDILVEYNKARDKVGRNPVAGIEDGSCSICGMAVPGSTLQRVRSGDELHHCSQCGRILYAG